MPQATTPPDAMARPRGGVAVYEIPGRPLDCEYEIESCRRIAQRLAVLKGLDYLGDYRDVSDGSGLAAGGPLYLVPTDTLIGSEASAALGVRDLHDLFGGVAPHAFVATKAITQPLVGPEAQAPEGWSHAFRERTRLAVLRGFSAFSHADARAAARRLFAYGPLRLKPVHARGGLGQVVAREMDAVEDVLAGLDAAELARDGLVLEENLVEVVTCSVGQVRVGAMVASYYGTQRLTRNNHGQEVYGGTRMHVVRGDFEALLRRLPDPHARMAVGQARSYDDAARVLFPGLLLSRSNYDVAQGVDARGRWCSGVLEQSWRLGGASPAEIVALEAFAADPALQAVRSECIELFGDDAMPPAAAAVLLDMQDPKAGRIRKFTICEEAADA